MNDLSFKRSEDEGNIILLMVFMFFNTIIVTWHIIFSFLPAIRFYHSYVAMLLILGTSAYLLVTNRIRIDFKGLLIPLLFVFWWMLTYFFNEGARTNLSTVIEWAVTQTIPCFLLVYSIRDIKLMLNYLYIESFFAIFVYGLAYVISTIAGIEISYMVVSYAVLPFACIMMSFSLRRPNIWNIFFSIAAIAMIIIRGARGAAVAAISFFVFEAAFNIRKKYSMIIVLAGILFVMFVYSSSFASTMLSFDNYLKAHNIESRTITKIVNDVVEDDNGRSRYWAAGISIIRGQPLWGYGICGDRNVIGFFLNTKDNYPHNFILEILIQMGVLGGFTFLGWLFYGTIKIISQDKDPYVKQLALILMPTAFVKLMLSSTYLATECFFMLMALVATRKRRLEDNRFDTGTYIGEHLFD